MKIISLALLVLLGCGTTANPQFCCFSEADCATFGLAEIRTCGDGMTCEGHRCVPATCSADTDCAADHPVCSAGVCVGCDEAHACPAVEPVCDLATSTCGRCGDHSDCAGRSEAPYCDGAGCVGCLSSSQCDASAPYCDGGACRKCELDAECESRACGLDGMCVPEEQSAWISATGTDANNSVCTRANPCSTLVYTLARLDGRKHVVMAPGVYPNKLNVSVPGLFIHGSGAIITHASTSTGPTLQLNAPDIVVRGLTMTSTNPGEIALLVSAEGILLDSVTFSGFVKKLNITALTPGLRASATARNLKISGSVDTAAIVVGASGELAIDRGEISGGTVGIQAEAGAKVRLRNVLIWGTSGRALELGQAIGEVEFSTIADAGGSSQAAPCAVACNPNVRVTSSIIWQPSCAVGAADAAGPCTFRSSIVSNGPAPGITNVDPRFVNPAGRDYHLQSSSPAKDGADEGPATDFEGDPRPRGARFDIGADEAGP